VGKSIEVIRRTLQATADGEVNQSEIDNAKGHLIGSFPLRFDAHAKIASQLLELFADGLGANYTDGRNDMIASVAIEDVRRVAKRLLDPERLIVAIAGRPV
jgi:zinc protease